MRGSLKQEIEKGAVPPEKRTEFSGNGEDDRTVSVLYEFEGKGGGPIGLEEGAAELRPMTR